MASDEQKETFRTVRFTLADDGTDSSQFAVVELALREAEKMAGSSKQGHLLTLICVYFLSNAVPLPEPH